MECFPEKEESFKFYSLMFDPVRILNIITVNNVCHARSLVFPFYANYHENSVKFVLIEHFLIYLRESRTRENKRESNNMLDIFCHDFLFHIS